MRASHLKPVSVSSYGVSAGAAAAIRDSSDDDTIVVANVPRAPLRTRCSASSAPTSSPRSIRQPAAAEGAGTATAQRSASGSFAMTMSGPTRRAVANARSMAPGSSGLGNATVGKSGSGSACSGTTVGAGKPARAKAAVRVVRPTPCMGV